MTRRERDARARIKDWKITGHAQPVRRIEKPRRGAVSTAAGISGKRTTLGDLIDLALKRFDARRVR